MFVHKLAAVGIALALAAPAPAFVVVDPSPPRLIDLRFSGTVDADQVSGILGDLSPAVSPGDRVRGSVRYLVSNTLDYGFSGRDEIDPGVFNSAWNFRPGTDTILEFDLILGDLAISYTNIDARAWDVVYIQSDPGGNFLEFEFFEESATGPDFGLEYDYFDFFLSFSNPEAGQLFDESQFFSPTPPADIGPATLARGGFVLTRFGPTFGGSADFTIDSYRVIPEPSSLGMMSLAGALMLGIRKR